MVLVSYCEIRAVGQAMTGSATVCICHSFFKGAKSSWEVPMQNKYGKQDHDTIVRSYM